MSRRRYIDDFKAQAVALSDSIGRTEAARRLDIPVKSLANWVDTVHADRPLRSPQRKPVSDLESEVARLRSENATLKMEYSRSNIVRSFSARPDDSDQ